MKRFHLDIFNTFVGSAISSLVIFASPAYSTILTFSGNFSGDFNDPTYIPYGNVSGNFSFDFDNSQVTGVGEELFLNIALTSFSMNPSTVGETTFDVNNSVGGLKYQNGILEYVGIGGEINDVGITHGDDFIFRSWSGAIVGVINNASQESLSGATNVVFNYSIEGDETPIPEPLTILGTTLVAGCLPILKKQKGKKAQ